MGNTATMAVVTERGRQLAARLISSETSLEIISAELGDGELSEEMDPQNMTALAHYVMDAPISDAGDPATGQIKVILQVLPTDVVAPFTAKEAALFAMDPDDGKILYAYIPMQSDPTELRPPENGVGKILLLEVSLPIFNIANVAVVLSPDALISRSTFEVALQAKADLVDGKVSHAQLPAMDYDPTGSAAAVRAEVLPLVAENASKIATLWSAIFEDITTNPFTVGFGNLSGLTVTSGVWNASLQRLEC